MKIVSCPVCNEQSDDTHINVLNTSSSDQKIFTIKKCPHCNTLYTFFSEDLDMAKYYDEGDYKIIDTGETIFFKIQKIEYTNVIKKIKEIYPAKNYSLLDFGCGKGIFLFLAKKEHWEIAGVETSANRSAYASKILEIEVNTAFYTEGSIFNKKFDILTLFHVIEHITDSRILLKNLVKDNLKENGLLVLEVPNIKSWQFQWSKERWLHLDVPRHLAHFDADTIKPLLENAGCQIIGQDFFSFHLGIIGMIQTIMSWFGYSHFLLAELKHKRTIPLLATVTILFPFALVLELLAAAFKKGAIIRYYALKKG